MMLHLRLIRRVSAVAAVKKPLEQTICRNLYDPFFTSRSSMSSFPTHTASSSSTSSSSSSAGDYVSPFADFFASIEKGQTTLNNNPTKTLAQQTGDMPLLKSGISEHVLRFRTTCYPRLMLPPYTQNSEYKVTLKVSLRDIPLKTELEKTIFLQIVGSRFIVDKKELRLTSEKFASRIENKRYLCSVLDRIVLGAQRLAQEMEKGNVSVDA